MAGKQNGKPIDVRFWEKTAIGVCEDDCWEWLGSTLKKHKTGRLRRNSYDGGKLDYSARVSWEIHYGPIPEGKWIVHGCGNENCDNPKHLRAENRSGTFKIWQQIKPWKPGVKKGKQ